MARKARLQLVVRQISGNGHNPVRIVGVAVQQKNTLKPFSGFGVTCRANQAGYLLCPVRL